MEVTTVKNILGITTTKHDTYLNEVTPLFVETAKSYCNNDFLNDDGVEVLPGAVKIAIAKWIEYNMHTAGVSGRSQGISYSYDTNVPDGIKALLKAYRRVSW